MVFYHIDKNNIDDINKVNKMIASNSNNKVFILIYMNGCGPCDETKPEWKKIENVLNELKNNENIAIVDIEQQYMNKLEYLKEEPRGFPTILYITEKGKVNEEYKDNSEQFRKIDSFVDWVRSKIASNGGKKINKTKRTNKTNKLNKIKRTNKTKKWSLKYKKSINCKKPKGFSQKQYCKYGRK
jgi:vacuolar-type H+-ATPase subunit F/Vma7